MAAGPRGGITKTGNGYARRLLIEAAWHHRKPYKHASVDLRRRWDAATPARAWGQQANRRLHARWQHVDARRKTSSVANTGHRPRSRRLCWSLATMPD